MKIIIHPLTYLLLLTIFLCGKFNYFLIISIILFVHDLGHILIMIKYKIRINMITIFPFGSIIDTNIKYNEKSYIKLLIALAGITFQVILYFIFNFLFKLGIISIIDYQIFMRYNLMIILFNLLPIVPLDGSKVLESILELFTPYKITLYLEVIISLIFICILFCKSVFSLDLIIIIIFLLYKSYEFMFNIKYIYYKFRLERYLNRVIYKKIKYIKNLNLLYKNRLNFINNIIEYKYFDRK